MPAGQREMGRLISAYPIAPVYVQRAVFIAVLSFIFFMAMMFAFYIRQSMVYFLLATAFLIVYLLTMLSWFFQRKTVVKIYDGGFTFKNHSLAWDEIGSVTQDGGIIIDPKDGKPFEIPKTIAEPEALTRQINFRLRSST